MDMATIFQHHMTPCVILGIVFGIAGHYFETKPQIIALGIIAIVAVQMFSTNTGDKMLESDLANLRDENDSLKQNLMQVYSMVQNQQQSSHSGPPPPIPPSMTGPPSGEKEDEDSEAKPYL